MSTVIFRIGDVKVAADFVDAPTARQILAALPIEASGSYWGQEFYFEIPVKAGYEPTACDVVDPGSVAYWPAGHCLCLFWGPTPASTGKECRAASNVNLVGRVREPELLKKLRGRSVSVERGTTE
jgi:uncharacterized protein